MLFLDLDDTLLSSDMSISETNLEAIKKASDAGANIVICTGRGIFSVKHIAQKLGVNNGYIICLNGGAVYKGFPPVLMKENLFESSSAVEIYKAAKKYGVDIQIYRDDRLIVENISERVKAYIDKLSAEYTVVDSIEEYDGKISKILLNGPNELLLKIEKEMKHKLNGKFNCFFSNPNYLEFTGIGSTKGEEVAYLAIDMGVDISETIAMGDSFNDISMVKAAGLGVAVRNAVQPLKDEADYITKATNDEGAVAEVINRYILCTEKVSVGEYKFRIPVRIFIIIAVIEQLIASAFNLKALKLLRYEYTAAGGDSVKFGVIAFIIPLVMCFVVDYFNQKTKGEDEEEFWISKYGQK